MLALRLTVQESSNIALLQLCFSVCPDCTEDSEWESRGGDGDDDSPDQMKEQQVSEGLRRSKRFVRKPSVQTETKYIELMVVNDNEMVSSKYILLLITVCGRVICAGGLCHPEKLELSGS